MGLTNIVDTNTNDSALLKQNFHPPRALFRLLDTLSHIIIAIKFATKLEPKQRRDSSFVLSVNFLVSFLSGSSMSCLTAQYRNTMNPSTLCHTFRYGQGCNH